MAPARHIALWLAAAIVSIIVGLAPSAAEAHGGHPHPASVHATSPHTEAGSVEASGTIVLRAAAIGTALTCLCPACLHCSSACCATGLTPAADLAWPVPGSDGRAVAHDGPIPPGIVPEALPEPPRPFA